MSLQHRMDLYRELEKHRGHPLIVYFTSDRKNAGGNISADAVAELLAQLQLLPSTTNALDMLLVSLGGDATVAWRIISLIREQVDSLAVLVPQAAYSAATLIALGADEIVMHPHGNLGPTDPQISGPGPGGPGQQISFGSEDLSAFLKFAREEVGLSDQNHMLEVFDKFCSQVGAVPIGVAARSSQLSLTMGEKLLKLHMTDENQQQTARAISEKLTKDFFHHGYPVNRSEAKQIGLPIAAKNKKTESLMWRIWSDIADELELRKPFMEMNILRSDPACAGLFGPMPTIQQIAAQATAPSIPPSPYQIIHAVMESARHASHFITEGLVFGERKPDLQFKVANVKLSQGWITIKPTSVGSKSKVTKKTKTTKKTVAVKQKKIKKKLAKKAKKRTSSKKNI